MAAGEVDDVDEITLTGAVCGVIIVAEDTEFREFAGGNFHDVGHEVIGDAVRVLAEEAGCVITDGVKISKGDDIEIGIGFGEVF